MITKIINEWDPIDLLSFTPEDEYSWEINEITNATALNDQRDTMALANEIDKIFAESFGRSTYTKTIEDSIIIAKKILRTINEN
jgi:hypothetical protein